jgi:outer membrane lipoprotein SlyB
MRNRKGDPELPPEKEPGDIYILTGVLLGLISGGIIGFLIAASGIVPTSLFFPLTIGGAIAGGVIGATIGNTVKKRTMETGTKKSEGNPFIND